MEEDAQIIASITEQPGAVVIRLASGETLTVAPDAVPPEMPGVGGSLGSPLLHVLRQAAARKLVARRLFELLNRRLWTMARLRRKLCDEGFEPDAVDSVLATAEAQGLHSDRVFAEAYCRDTLRGKAVGRAWLEVKLRDQGVPRELAASVVRDQLSSDQERALARQAASRRWRREAARDDRARSRVLRFLASRGFPAAVAREAARAEE